MMGKRSDSNNGSGGISASMSRFDVLQTPCTPSASL